MQRQIALLHQFVHDCCGISPPSQQMVSDLMAPTFNDTQRLFGAVVRISACTRALVIVVRARDCVID